MISLIKNVVMMFCKNSGISLTAIGLVGSISLLFALYLSSESLKNEIDKQQLIIIDRDKEIKSLNENIKDLDNKITETERSYEKAIERRNQLEQKLYKLEIEYRDQVKVFEKEKGRYSRLFEKKASLLVIKANKATKERGDEIHYLTTDN